MGLERRKNKIYASILSDGSIRVKTFQDDPSAVKREYELPDGTSGIKYEKVYDELSGLVTGISFNEGKYGTSLHVVVKDEESIILTAGLSTSFAEDLMKKIPNFNLTKSVTIRPYSFDDDKGKNRKGVTVWQEGEKIKSFFHDENNKPIEGFPVPEKDYKDCDKDDWRIFFIKQRKFLRNYLETSTDLVVNFEGEDFGEIDETNSSNINRGDNAEVEKLSQAKKDLDSINVEDIDFEAMKKEIEANEAVKVNVGTTKRKVAQPVETVSKPAIENVPAESAIKGAPTPLVKENTIKELIKEKFKVEGDDKVKIAAMQKTNLPYLPENYDKIIEMLKGLKVA